jgi:polysaccharide biosynthesis PFTS motif protein
MLRGKYFSIFTIIFQKKERFKYRAIYRGYKKLKYENKLHLITQLRDFLSETRVNIGRVPAFLKADFDEELSIRQYLTNRILGKSFNKSILYSIGTNKSLKHPLPKEWCQVLIEQEIQVNILYCSVLWHWYVFLFWGHGVIQGLKSIFYLLQDKPKFGKSVYFYKINKSHLPINGKEHNIVNWYFQWKNREKEVNIVMHSDKSVANYKFKNIEIIYTDGLPYIGGGKLFKYFFLQSYLYIYSLIFMFSKPYSAIMLGELIKLTRVRISEKNQLSADYMFHNSGSYYRPIWTYEAFKKKVRIFLYYYSTNGRNFKTKRGYPLQNPWHLINWPHYLVWDSYQASILKQFNKCNSTVEIVGDIWFSSSDMKIPELSQNSVAVFDVQPMRSTYYVTMGLNTTFYEASTAIQFLNDVQDVLGIFHNKMIHKMKRTSIYTHKKYLHNLNELKKQSNYIEICPDLDALKVIKKTRACISFPFTSTAIIAKYEGKPSVYYDPTGMIQKDDIAAHGIPVLIGKQELFEWVEDLHE